MAKYQFSLSIHAALTGFWTGLTSCLAVMLIHHGVLLEAITSWLQGLIRLRKLFFNSANQLY